MIPFTQKDKIKIQPKPCNRNPININSKPNHANLCICLSFLGLILDSDHTKLFEAFSIGLGNPLKNRRITPTISESNPIRESKLMWLLKCKPIPKFYTTILSI